MPGIKRTANDANLIDENVRVSRDKQYQLLLKHIKPCLTYNTDESYLELQNNFDIETIKFIVEHAQLELDKKIKIFTAQAKELPLIIHLLSIFRGDLDAEQLTNTCELIQVLIDNGAQLDKVDELGNSFLHYVCEHDPANISDLLQKIKIPAFLYTERNSEQKMPWQKFLDECDGFELNQMNIIVLEHLIRYHSLQAEDLSYLAQTFYDFFFNFLEDDTYPRELKFYIYAINNNCLELLKASTACFGFNINKPVHELINNILKKFNENPNQHTSQYLQHYSGEFLLHLAVRDYNRISQDLEKLQQEPNSSLEQLEQLKAERNDSMKFINTLLDLGARPELKNSQHKTPLQMSNFRDWLENRFFRAKKEQYQQRLFANKTAYDCMIKCEQESKVEYSDEIVTPAAFYEETLDSIMLRDTFKPG